MAVGSASACNILTNAGWILMEFNAAMHDARRMDTNDFEGVPDVCSTIN